MKVMSSYLVPAFVDSLLFLTFLLIFFDTPVHSHLKSHFINFICISAMNIIRLIAITDQSGFGIKALDFFLLTIQAFLIFLTEKRKFWYIICGSFLYLFLKGSINILTVLFWTGFVQDLPESRLMLRCCAHLTTLFVLVLMALIKRYAPKYSCREKTRFLLMAVSLVCGIALSGGMNSYIQNALPNPRYLLSQALGICFLLQIFENFRLNDVVQQKEYCLESTEKILNNLRRQKHNYDNVLHTVYGLAFMGKNDELCNYLKEVSAADYNSYIECKNPCVAALMSTKLGKFADVIQVNADIKSDLCSVNLSDYELCECLGILLDNAYEAAVSSDGKWISVEIYDVMDYTVIKVKNSFSGDINTDRIFHKGYSTKGEGRGMGLFVVKEIMGRRNNEIDVVVGNNEITFSLILKKVSRKMAAQAAR